MNQRVSQRDVVPPEHQVRTGGVLRGAHRPQRFTKLQVNNLPSERSANVKSFRTIAMRFREREYPPKRPTIPPQNSANIIENGRTCFRNSACFNCETWSPIHQVTSRRSRTR